MSEKRFCIDEKTNYKDYPIILDTKTGDWWVIQDTMMGTGKLLDLLNEQQDKIAELEKNFEDLVNWSSEIAKRNVVLDEQIGELQRENKQLRKELGDCEKFRYTVFKRLNDEIKLLKPTNIEQYEQIQKLQEENEKLKQKVDFYKYFQKDARELEKENEKLRENLHNCRLNKNIISEKLKLWQDVHKEYNIYNINDFEELMKSIKQKQ